VLSVRCCRCVSFGGDIGCVGGRAQHVVEQHVGFNLQHLYQQLVEVVVAGSRFLHITRHLLIHFTHHHVSSTFSIYFTASHLQVVPLLLPHDRHTVTLHHPFDTVDYVILHNTTCESGRALPGRQECRGASQVQSAGSEQQSARAPRVAEPHPRDLPSPVHSLAVLRPTR